MKKVDVVLIYAILVVTVVFTLLLPVVILFGSIWQALLFIAVILWGGYEVFKDSLNLLQVVGPIYWVTRYNATPKFPRLCIAFMHEDGKPWRTGTGIQVRFRKYSFQVGICHKHGEVSDEEGELIPVGGRHMIDEPEDIGEW